MIDSGRPLMFIGGGGDNSGMQFVHAGLQSRKCLLGDVELGQPGPRLRRPSQHAIDIRGVLPREPPQLGLTGQLRFQSAGITGQFGQEVAQLTGDVADHRDRLDQPLAQRLQRGVVSGTQRGSCLSHTVGGRGRFGTDIVDRARQPTPRHRRCIA